MSNTWWRDVDELVKEQSDLLDIPTDVSLLIKGPPGSGKTNLLLLRANQLFLGDRPNLHVVVFGSLLKQFIRIGGVQYKFPDEKVVTHTQLFASILRSEGVDIDSSNMSLDDSRKERAKRLSGLIKAKKIGVMFEALLLDEAQDYEPLEIEIFRGLTEVLIATADTKQKIYEVADCSEILEKSVNNIYALKYHFRNGLDICRLADGLQKGKPGYVPLLQHTNYKEKDYPSKVYPRPNMDLPQQAAAIAEQIKDQRFAYPDEIIGVMCPKNDDLNEISAGLVAAGLGASLTRANSNLFDASRPVWLSTLTAAKGLEFRAAHIAGLDNLSRMGAVQRRLLFTGVTRAKTTLSLYWNTSIPGYLQSALLALDPPKPVTKQNIFGKP